MENRKRICFITTAHLSSNPRLVKEVSSAVSAGHTVSVIYNQYAINWNRFDAEIMERFPDVNWIGLDWIGTGIRSWVFKYYSGALQKTSRFLFSFLKIGVVLKLAANRNFYLQLSLARRERADIYIGHTLGTLPVVVEAAEANKSLSGFDAEDFHRNEMTDDTASINYLLPKLIEDRYIPRVSYLSTASPLISRAYGELYPTQQPLTINNTFSVDFLQMPSNHRETLKLFWFSQTIGAGRGIEDVMRAIAKLNGRSITLTLLGNCTDSQLQYWVEVAKSCDLDWKTVTILAPVREREIFSIAARHHIGLALEQQTPRNRDVCLTNKLFTYLLSSLAVIATETEAQKDFFNKYPGVGETIPIGDVEAIVALLDEWASDPEKVCQMQKKAHATAFNQLNWEKEQKKFLKLLEERLQ